MQIATSNKRSADSRSVLRTYYSLLKQIENCNNFVVLMNFLYESQIVIYNKDLQTHVSVLRIYCIHKQIENCNNFRQQGLDDKNIQTNQNSKKKNEKTNKKSTNNKLQTKKK